MTDWFGFVVAQWPAGELVLASRALAFQWFGILSIWLKFFVFYSITLHNGRTCIAIIICSNTWQLEWMERHTKWFDKWKCTAYKRPVPPENRQNKILPIEILLGEFWKLHFQNVLHTLKALLTQYILHVTWPNIKKKPIILGYKVSWKSNSGTTLNHNKDVPNILFRNLYI